MAKSKSAICNLANVFTTNWPLSSLPNSVVAINAMLFRSHKFLIFFTNGGSVVLGAQWQSAVYYFQF
jgi:hypothetical protein